MPKIITSLQNPRVMNAVKLRSRRGRDKQGRIIIDGARELGRAIQAGVEIVEIYVCRELDTSGQARAVLQTAAESGALLCEISPDVFAKLAYGQRSEAIVGVARRPGHTLAGLTLPDNPLIAVLAAVEKPGNMGAVARSADGARVSALVVADGGTDLYNPNAIRASLGTIFTLPVRAARGEEVVRWLHSQNVNIYAACVDGATNYTGVDYTGPTAIVLGSESAGLSDIWRAEAVRAIKLPMHGAADSLNVSATAAVLFYEALRQRTH